MLNFQPDRFRPSKGKKPCETVVNLKATKAIGLDVPSPACARRWGDRIGGHATPPGECPLSGVKRTLVGHAPMSASDPKRTLPRAERHFRRPNIFSMPADIRSALAIVSI